MIVGKAIKKKKMYVQRYYKRHKHVLRIMTFHRWLTYTILRENMYSMINYEFFASARRLERSRKIDKLHSETSTLSFIRWNTVAEMISFPCLSRVIYDKHKLLSHVG